MANTISILADERIQYDGYFDLAELYKHAYNWLNWRKFDVAESKYTEKAKAAGKEMEMIWSATKTLDEYSKFEIKVRWQLFAIRDEEVKKGNTVVKMQRGEINIYITVNLITDRQDFWAQNAFYSFMRAFYDRYLYRSSVKRLKDEGWTVGWEFFNELKAFLNLYKY